MGTAAKLQSAAVLMFMFSFLLSLSQAQDVQSPPPVISAEPVIPATQNVTPGPVIPLPPGTQGTINFQVDDPAIYSKTKIIPLVNLKASEVEPFIRSRLSRFGSVQVNDELNSLILTDREPKLGDLENLILELDKSGKKEFVQFETQVIPLKYVKASTFTNIARQKLSSFGTLQTNDDLNVLIITDVKSKIEGFKQVIQSLDIPPKQILLDAQIIEYRKTENNDYGIDIASLLEKVNTSYSESKQKTTNAYSPTDVNTYTNKNRSLQFSLSQGSVNNIVNYLFQNANARIVSSQRIVTLNNRTGTIRIDTGVNGGGFGGNTHILELSVTPTIGNTGTVLLDIEAGTGAFQTINTTTTTFQNRVTSSVIVKEGDTFVLGGFEIRVGIKTKRKFPLLGDIPLVDYFFSKRIEQFENREYVVFITPHVVTESKPSEVDKDALKKILEKK